MDSLENSVRDLAKKLLSEKRVDLVIGYEQGKIPLRTSPCFVDKTENVDRLVWNVSCEANLSKYLIGRKEKVGVIAKACDARSIAVCIIEKQIAKERTLIIGVPCSGVIDRKKVAAKLGNKEALEAVVEGEMINLRGKGFELKLPILDFICDSCSTCKHRNPPVYDILVGEKTHELTEVEEFSSVTHLESRSSKERWEHFEKELGKCIRCYACRNVCPLCYCKVCFVDQTLPTWFGKTNELSDTMIYHLVRTFHMAGRCVDCGACSRACPMNIDLRELMKKIEKIMKDRFDYEAGIDLEKNPPLGEFKMDDSQEFIR